MPILFGIQISINNIQTRPSDFFAGKTVGTLAGIGGANTTAAVLITIWLVPLGMLAIFVFAGEIRRIKLKNET